MKIKLNNNEIELTDEQCKEIVEKYGKSEEFKGGESYWYIVDDVYGSNWYNIKADKFLLETGNAFHTREEAETEIERRKVKTRLWKWAKENAPFTPDWGDDSEPKYCSAFFYRANIMAYDSCWSNKTQTELPYFKSREDVDLFIKENESDLIFWFTK